MSSEPKVEHGSYTRYRKHGCRCVECKEANALHARMARETAAKCDPNTGFLFKKVPAVVTENAACKGMDPAKFFPLRGHVRGSVYSPEVAEALAACARCEVRDECLTHALDAPERTGIWGGTFERERRVLRRERRRQLLLAVEEHPANPKPKPAPSERVIGIPHSRNTFMGDRIA